MRDHRHRELHLLEDTDPVQGGASVWTASDVDAFIESNCGNLTLTLLANGRLVSSSMQQNNNIDYAIQHLHSCSEFTADLKSNIKIRDEKDPSFMLVLVPS